MADHPYGKHPVSSVEGPDCSNCGHFADWHHLGGDGRFGCIGCACQNYAGELHDDGPEEVR